MMREYKKRKKKEDTALQTYGWLDTAENYRRPAANLGIWIRKSAVDPPEVNEHTVQRPYPGIAHRAQL